MDSRPTASPVLCQSRHPDGSLAKEFSLLNGTVVGAVREWHDNGVLAREEPFESGRVHGAVRQWDRSGRLLGEYEMAGGRGVERVWSEDGSLQTEFEQVSPSGSRGTVYDDLGGGRQVFLWNGTVVSRKTFEERLARESLR
jgi:antitoxin component YwqK of YwqJK toxin-antitoxin module